MSLLWDTSSYAVIIAHEIFGSAVQQAEWSQRLLDYETILRLLPGNEYDIKLNLITCKGLPLVLKLCI